MLVQFNVPGVIGHKTRPVPCRTDRNASPGSTALTLQHPAIWDFQRYIILGSLQ